RLGISVGCNDHGLAAEFRLEGFLEFGNTGRVAVPAAAFKDGSDKGVPARETRRLFRTAGDLEDERSLEAKLDRLLHDRGNLRARARNGKGIGLLFQKGRQLGIEIRRAVGVGCNLPKLAA